MWPDTITSSIPTAMMTMWLFCSARLVRFTGRNRVPSVTTWKKIMITTSANRIPY